MSEELASLRARVAHLERQLSDMKDKYIKLLEGSAAIGSQKSEVPQAFSPELAPLPSSTQSRSSARLNSPWSSVVLTDIQLLFLLKESRATNKQYAATASQLCKVYNLNRSVKTIRNKLNDLGLRGFVGVIGQKPKGFFITPAGLAALDRQRRSAINVRY